MVLEQFMKIRGMASITKWKGDDGCVNCPEGSIQLPSDIWKCKISKEGCGIQGQIPLDDKERFFAWCKASDIQKESIFKTVTSGTYTGFHHHPGRFLCPQCQSDRGKKVNERYHYQWEFASVSNCVDFSGEFKSEVSGTDKIKYIDEDMEGPLKKQGYLLLEDMLRNKGFEPSAASCLVCARCCKRIVSDVFPEIAHQLRVLELDFYQR
jgi:hypothetical protein